MAPNRALAYGISSPSTNVIPAPTSQYTAGPANGKRRRAKIGSTRTAIAGRQNHNVVRGAPQTAQGDQAVDMEEVAREHGRGHCVRRNCRHCDTRSHVVSELVEEVWLMPET